MTGSDIIGELLRAHAPLTDLVPVDRIKGGRLPEACPLPALLVRTISSVERQRLKRGASVRWTDRIRVTVRAASYDEQLIIIDLVDAACADRRGTIAGAERVSVLTAGTGPDLDGPGDSFEQAKDFRASFDRPAPEGE
jgi:hypothetical protein